MKGLILALGLLLSTTQSSTSEELSIGVRPISGGYICDTEDQVKRLIAQQGLPIEGCGQMIGTTPANVILYDVYEADGYRFALARYEFTGAVSWGSQTQYGWWGTAQPIPISLEKEGELL